MLGSGPSPRRQSSTHELHEFGQEKHSSACLLGRVDTAQPSPGSAHPGAQPWAPPAASQQAQCTISICRVGTAVAARAWAQWPRCCNAAEDVLGILWQAHSSTTPLTPATVSKTSGGPQLQEQLQLCAMGSLGQHCHPGCTSDGKVVEVPSQRRAAAVGTPQYTG